MVLYTLDVCVGGHNYCWIKYYFRQSGEFPQQLWLFLNVTETLLWLFMLATFRRKGKFILLIRKICYAWKYYLWISEFAAGLIKTQHCFSYQKNVSFLMEVPPRINMFKMINTFYETNCISLQKNNIWLIDRSIVIKTENWNTENYIHILYLRHFTN